MLLVVHHHNATHGQSFQAVDRLQNSALKEKAAEEKGSRGVKQGDRWVGGSTFGVFCTRTVSVVARSSVTVW